MLDQAALQHLCASLNLLGTGRWLEEMDWFAQLDVGCFSQRFGGIAISTGRGRPVLSRRKASCTVAGTSWGFRMRAARLVTGRMGFI